MSGARPASAVVSFAAIAAVVAVGAPAAADSPPPPGYVETCTLAKQCPTGLVCSRVQGKIDAACAQTAKDRGLEQRCSSYGATVADVVYCPKGAPLPPAEKKGCAVGPSPRQGEAPAAPALLVALGALATLARRLSPRFFGGAPRRAPAPRSPTR